MNLTQISPTQEVIDEAFAIYNNYDHANFPEDDWQSIGTSWDLNLWLDEEGCHRATLYPVVDGRTITDLFYTVK